MLRATLFALLATSSLALGCHHAESPGYGPVPPCPAGEQCKPGGVVGGGTSGSSSATSSASSSAGATTGTLSGQVGVLSGGEFDSAVALQGKADVIVDLGAGMHATASYTDAATGFSLDALPTGLHWVFAQDGTNGAAHVLSTFSLEAVPSANVMVPLVDLDMLTTVTASMPVPVLLAPGAAHVIVHLERNGSPLAGVAVSSTLPKATIAYDVGSGAYSTVATQTGNAGIVLLLNVPTSGSSSIEVDFLDGQSKSFSSGLLPIAKDAATVAGLTL